jgi:hypothetical protein
MSDSQHIGDECLENYHLGQIGDDAQLESVETHLSRCRKCRERARTIEDGVTIVRYGLNSVL